MPPPDWSNLWEKKGWNHFPGESRLVILAQRWLRDAEPDPSWQYVWQALYDFFPEDQQYLEVALWWLEHRGPRERGAWTLCGSCYGTKIARDSLAPIGWRWVKEFEDHKYWSDVRARLAAGAPNAD